MLVDKNRYTIQLHTVNHIKLSKLLLFVEKIFCNILKNYENLMNLNRIRMYLQKNLLF